MRGNAERKWHAMREGYEFAAVEAPTPAEAARPIAPVARKTVEIPVFEPAVVIDPAMPGMPDGARRVEAPKTPIVDIMNA